MLGRAPAALVGTRALDFLHPEDLRLGTAAREAMIRSGEGRFEARAIRKDGSICFRSLLLVRRTGDRSRGLGHFAFSRDSTPSRRAEEKFRGLLEAAPDAMVIVDRRGRIVLVNEQAERLFGYRREELAGKPIEILVPDRLRAGHVGRRDRYLGAPQVRRMGTALDLAGRRKDGTEFPAEISLSPIRTEEGILVSSAIRDSSDRKRMEEALRSLSLADDLTGLHSRRGFLELAPTLLRLAARRRERAILLCADLDGLKAINDSHGHSAGDRAIRAVASVLTETFRRADVLARIGGDEFAALALTGLEGASAIRHRLRRRIEEEDASGRLGFPFALSVGTALFDPESPTPLETLLQRADAAMYAEKRAKRRRPLPLSLRG